MIVVRTRLGLGRVTATPGVLEQVPKAEIFAALSRHQRGDWGDLTRQDKRANDEAFQKGGRILSAYRSREDVPFWIITEADRSYTTVLLPEEY